MCSGGTVALVEEGISDLAAHAAAPSRSEMAFGYSCPIGAVPIGWASSSATDNFPIWAVLRLVSTEHC